MEIYVVMHGDNIYSIAAQYGVNAEKIIADNQLVNPGKLAVGQTLVIQIPSKTHTVSTGESLYGIARRYDTTVDAILRNNPELKGKALIYPGQMLTISLNAKKKGNLFVNGYTYTYLKEDELRKVLPYLTSLTIFTYEIDEKGNIYAPNDEPYIRWAKEYGVEPIMSVSSLNTEGYFDSTLSSAILTNKKVKNNLIKNIIQTMQEKGYETVDVDFEYIPADEAELYAQFIEELRMAVSELGYRVTVALAPKTSAKQQGQIYEGHLYPELSRAADGVLLMTYEWGYTYGPPMAIAPIDKVEEVVKYAVTEIDPQKIYLGIPIYGYDWILPYQQGVGAKSVSPEEAVSLAIQNHVSIKYDYTVQAPYFYYKKDGQEHIVWFDDARSIEEKLNLANSYGLAGVAYWNLMRPFTQNWLVLNAQYNIIKR